MNQEIIRFQESWSRREGEFSTLHDQLADLEDLGIKEASQVRDSLARIISEINNLNTFLSKQDGTIYISSLHN